MNQTKRRTSQKTIGKTIGKSIKNQLSTLQFSIGCAPFWKALTAIIATERKTPVQDTHPNLMVGIFFNVAFSM